MRFDYTLSSDNELFEYMDRRLQNILILCRIGKYMTDDNYVAYDQQEVESRCYMEARTLGTIASELMRRYPKMNAHEILVWCALK